jgi:hypothetical protein
MAGNDCMISLQVCALRLARLAADGTTPAGVTNMYVTDKLAKLDVNPNYETGDEITVKTGCGAIAAAYKDLDRLKRADVTLTVLTSDPELSELAAGFSLITSGGQSVGAAWPAVGSAPPAGVSIEAWNKAWLGGGPPPGQVFTDAVLNTTTTVTSATAAFTSADVGRTISGTGIPAATTIASVTNATTIIMSAAATATAAGVTITLGRPGAYYRWVLPRVILKPETKTLEDAPSLSVFSGPAMENAGWGNGPLNDWPAGAVSGRVLAWIRDAALPTVACGYGTTPVQV